MLAKALEHIGAIQQRKQLDSHIDLPVKQKNKLYFHWETKGFRNWFVEDSLYKFTSVCPAIIGNGKWCTK